jgi:dTDP-4-dehydrorhamnose reductase
MWTLRAAGAISARGPGKGVNGVVVIGSTGQLGSDCLEAFADRDVVGLAHGDLEIGDAAQVEAVLGRLRPSVVVNTAAFHNVPRCETEPERAFALNAVAPWHLARTCSALGARLIHVSTDYVFDGARHVPYAETDRPAPLNVYGISKLAGEHAVLAVGGDHQVVRSSGLYGVRPCRAKGGNFLDTMATLAATRPEITVVDDECCTPTFTADLAAQLRVLADAGRPGLYHATSHGQCSWFAFAQELFRLMGWTTPLRPISVRELAPPVRRPAWSVLANAALAAQGLDRMRPWPAALAECVRRRRAAAS